MSNRKKSRFERLEEAQNAEVLKGEEENTLPESFVVVLAYNRTDDDTSEEFVKMVEDFKALFSLREGMRAYALVDDAAQEVLDIVETSGSDGG